MLPPGPGGGFREEAVDDLGLEGYAGEEDRACFVQEE